jgi:hypothetical protein
VAEDQKIGDRRQGVRGGIDLRLIVNFAVFRELDLVMRYGHGATPGEAPPEPENVVCVIGVICGAGVIASSAA